MFNFRFILLLLLIFSGDAKSYCRDYVEQGKNKFNYTYVCQNSLPTPPYLIVRQYIDDIEFELFELGHSDIRLMCSTVKLGNGKYYGGCDHYGIRGLQSKYINGQFTIDINRIESEPLKRLYEKKSEYRFPDLFQQVEETGCAIILGDNRMIYWRYQKNEPEKLSECLLNFELYATKKKIRFK